MTLREIISALREAGIEDPQRDALLLSSAIEGVSEASLLCDRDRPLTSGKLAEAVRRRAAREPLQYILGTWEFMGLPHRVSPSCLIPRADTELLTEFAISELPTGGRLLDLCTGSGCIAIAVAHYRPDAIVTAVEKYPETLACARINAELNGVGDRVRLLLGDVTDKDGVPQDGRFDMIVSNPPYVTAEEMETLEPELSHEPRAALTDGGDGLSILSAVVENYVPLLSPGGIMAVEHGSLQGGAVRKMMEKYGCVTTLRDLGGRERVTVLRTHK